ncbi:MAG TPA: hypothetical protein VNP90_04270 [Actinomycetota bacterium]|nr:hypothetical protein [Actinomycetota bacterium]
MTEAEEVFANQVTRWRADSWEELRQQIDESPVAYELAGPSGITYQFEALILWDDPREETNIRLFLTGDDGKGWRVSSRRMRNDSFILSPDGMFVGE